MIWEHIFKGMRLKFTLTEDDAEAMYGRLRSEHVHGKRLQELSEEDRIVLEKFELLIRCTLQRIILDDSFASLFSDDDSVKQAFPVP